MIYFDIKVILVHILYWVGSIVEVGSWFLYLQMERIYLFLIYHFLTIEIKYLKIIFRVMYLPYVTLGSGSLNALSVLETKFKDDLT